MGSIRPRSFVEYAQMFWRRKWLFLSVAGFTFLALFIIINRLPNSYESRAAVVVTGKQDDRQAIADRVAAVRERLTSRAFLEGVAKKNSLATGSQDSLDDAVDHLLSNTKVETTFRGDFPERLTVSYKDRNPQLAKEVATGLVSAFGNMNAAIEKQTTAEADSLNNQLNEVENRLEQMGKRTGGHRIFRGGHSQPDMNAIRAERAAATSSIETLSDKQFTLEREIAEQKQQIAEQQKIVKTVPADVHSGGSLGVLLVRKAELEAQMKDYGSQYTDKNPKVIQSRNQLEEINRQIAEVKADAQGNPAINSAEARELRSMQRELARMETELEVTQRTLDRKKQALDSTPNVSRVAASAPIVSSDSGSSSEVDAPALGGSEYERLKNRYDSLLRRQERLEYESMTAAGLDPGLFQIVDMPSVPQSPSGPNRLKYDLMALAFSLLLGLAVVIAVEIPKLFQIRDDRDVEYYLSPPVIVYIPETVSTSENGRARRLVGSSIGVWLLIAAFVPVLLYLLSNFRVIHLMTNLLSR